MSLFIGVSSAYVTDLEVGFTGSSGAMKCLFW